MLNYMLIILLLLFTGTLAEEFAVTREYTDYLKQHVDWEVVDYEDNIFRGWTLSELQALTSKEPLDFGEPLPIVEPSTSLPRSFYQDPAYIHEARLQGGCSSGWIFAVAGMLSDRCYQYTGVDHGWLSVQELISCDAETACHDEYASSTITYVNEHGLVAESCLPYTQAAGECPIQCVDGSNWASSHVCKCEEAEQCIGVDGMKTCLTQSGTITAAMSIDRPFYSYSSGIYKCQGRSTGFIYVDIVAYNEDPECYWVARNSWGTSWGQNGMFHIACDTCGIAGTYTNTNVRCKSIESSTKY